AANSALCLQSVSVLNTGYIFDPDFENNPADAGPLGTWIPANDPIQLGIYGYSRVQSSAWASTGNKCMYLRFLGEATSYNSISQKLHALTPGATYRLDLKYKCQSTSATSLVNIYAATTPNANKSAAIDGVFATTSVAASNLATQVPQAISLTFVAPATTVYIVYSKNTTTTNYNFFIDDLVLTEITPSEVENISMSALSNVYKSDNKTVVYFELNTPGEVQIELINLQGEILMREKINFRRGQNKKILDINPTSGLYLIRLTNEGKSASRKVVF
ncbi:MAG TPA: T9SS type A sorting domain-containing protein, partial [Paludibacter sp.]|nr:T9SS type A sorting domain-containing protein [Paludibacter sp.]